MTWTFVHEMAHRVDYYADENNLYAALERWTEKKVNVNQGPTILARYNARQDIAESITWYVWGRQRGYFKAYEQKRFLWRTWMSPRDVLIENPNGAGDLVGGREEIVQALFDTYKAKYPPQCGPQVWDYRDLPGGW